MIDVVADLRDVVRQAREAGHVALDTEFVWERTYYPRLGVVQIAWSQEDSYLIDVVTIEDLSPLGELLSDASVEKILHDPQQDLTILRGATGAYPTNVFDTRRAAGFVGLTCSISLVELLRELFGLHLTNSQTRTDWTRRPLSAAQVEYAIDDVRYLRGARDELLGRAAGLGREAWVNEEMRLYDDPALYEARDPQVQFERVKGARRLQGRRLAALRELARWREDQAQVEDVPRAHIAPDEVLIALAKRMPRTRDDLRSIRGRFDRDRHGDQVLAAVKQGAGRPHSDWPRFAPAPPQDEALSARIDLVLAYVKGKGIASGVDPALLATRAEMSALVLEGVEANPEDHTLLQGWRRQFLGEELLRFMSGDGAITLDRQTGLPRLVTEY